MREKALTYVTHEGGGGGKGKVWKKISSGTGGPAACNSTILMELQGVFDSRPQSSIDLTAAMQPTGRSDGQGRWTAAIRIILLLVIFREVRAAMVVGGPAFVFERYDDVLFGLSQVFFGAVALLLCMLAAVYYYLAKGSVHAMGAMATLVLAIIACVSVYVAGTSCHHITG